MHMTPLHWVLAVMTPLLELLLIVVLVRKKLHKRFPVFLNFVVFSAAASTLEGILGPYLSQVQYFYLYWSFGAVSMILCLGITYEVFIYMLKPYDALRDFAKILFRWATLFLLIASVLTALATTGSQLSKICTALLLFQRVVELMQCGILLLILLFESKLELSWRNPAIGIAVGTGSFAAIDLCMSVVAERFPAWQGAIATSSTVLSILVLGSFLYLLIIAEADTKSLSAAPSRLILQRWNEVLMNTPLVSRRADDLGFSPVESFIPGVEKAVDRVLARKMSH